MKEPRIWEQNETELLGTLGRVKAVHKAYQDAFAHEKARLAANPDRNQFDFPAMGVFGKSDTFVDRINKVEKMFAAITTLVPRIDGLGPAGWD